MGTLGVWNMVAIFYQTIFCVIISWLVLSCKLLPESSELHEVTLMKLLYFYDPEACGRIQFYNYTTTDTSNGVGTAVMWPVKNEVAAAFRYKIQLWIVLHLIWALLALVVKVNQGARPCGFYVTLLPFTLTGLTILIVDVVFCALFLVDAKKTDSETAILEYINPSNKGLHNINGTLHHPDDTTDTSWIAIVMAYSSIRGIVQWIINFWIVKDSYFDGLLQFHCLQNVPKGKTGLKLSQSTQIQV